LPQNERRKQILPDPVGNNFLLLLLLSNIFSFFFSSQFPITYFEIPDFFGKNI